MPKLNGFRHNRKLLTRTESKNARAFAFPRSPGSQELTLSDCYRVPEIIFWHIPSIAFSKVAPKPNSEIDKPCVGSINLESVAPQDAEWGIMDILAKRPSVKVRNINFKMDFA